MDPESGQGTPPPEGTCSEHAKSEQFAPDDMKWEGALLWCQRIEKGKKCNGCSP